MAAYGSGSGYRRSESGRHRVGLFLDYEELKKDAENMGDRFDPFELALRVMELAREEGRVILSSAYADWTDSDHDPRPFRRQQMDTRLVLDGDDFDNPSWLPMSLDILETLYTEPRVDTYVIAGGAPEMEEVIKRLRRFDRKVVLCASGYSCPQDLVQMADRYARVEEILGPATQDGEGALDFERYDWAPFVRALDWHEKRMEFIGIGLLLKKILDHRNCGYTSYARKREIFEKAKDESIIEIYTVPNIEAGADPVSACRLHRNNDLVQEVLGPETKEPEERGEGEKEEEGPKEEAGEEEGEP